VIFHNAAFLEGIREPVRIIVIEQRLFSLSANCLHHDCAQHQHAENRSGRQKVRRLARPPHWAARTAASAAETKPHASAQYPFLRVALWIKKASPPLMVLLAASVSLRFTEDMSRSELLSPVAAAWIPVVIGGLTAFVVLLYRRTASARELGQASVFSSWHSSACSRCSARTRAWCRDSACPSLHAKRQQSVAPSFKSLRAVQWIAGMNLDA
jgi:hypothetical protein